LGFFTQPALGVARARGWAPVHWTRDSRDWKPEATAGTIVERLTRRLRGGEIFVQHDGDQEGTAPWRKSAAALPRLLDELRGRGLEPALVR
jgi:hypothetical protein